MAIIAYYYLFFFTSSFLQNVNNGDMYGSYRWNSSNEFTEIANILNFY